MKSSRDYVIILGVLALGALFFLLPATPGPGCRACASNSPYLPLLGAGYFSLLITLSLCFPFFPGRMLARSGLTWSVLLALTFTYLLLPGWCPLCLVAHGCHILMWVIWVLSSPRKSSQCRLGYKEGLCLSVTACFSVVALFSSLNLTMLAYGLKIRDPIASGLRAGDTVPSFEVKTMEGLPLTQGEERYLINFVSGSCPYCKEQLSILSAFAELGKKSGYRLINVSSDPFPEWEQGLSNMEWVADREKVLSKLFQVSGYPTLFVVEANGKVGSVIAGVPDQLNASLQQLSEKK